MGAIDKIRETADALGDVATNAAGAVAGLREAAGAARETAAGWQAANEQIGQLAKTVEAASKSIFDATAGVREMFDTISEKTRDNPLALYWNEVLNKFQEGTISAAELYEQLGQIEAGMGRVSAMGANFLGPAIADLQRYKGELADIIKKIDEGKRRGKEAVDETKKAAESVGKVGKGGKSAGGKLTSTSSRVDELADLQRILVSRNNR